MTATRFPRSDYGLLKPYDPGRIPVEVDLSDNTNLWGPHPAAMAVIRTSPPEALTRYPTVYGTTLKEAVAMRFGVSPENVTTGCGSDDLLDSAFRAVASPPGRMTFPEPTFSMVEVFARMNGLVPHSLPWSDAEPDPGALLTEDPDLIYLCRPNNPTGHSSPRAWVENLLRACGPQGPIVALDEAYADFGQDDFLQEAVESDRLLVLRTFSKLYGLAGLRVGFGIGPAPLIREVEKSRGPYKVNGMAEAATVAALRDDSGWTERIVQETVQNRERLRGELEARGLKPLPSQANFLLFPVDEGLTGSLPGPIGGGALRLASALKSRGVAARPFPALSGIGDAVRVSIGPWNLMERFLFALDSCLDSGGSQ